MSYFRHSGNSLIPSEKELDEHLAENASEEEPEPLPPMTESQRCLAVQRANDFDARLRQIQLDQETTCQIHNRC
ncbi:MAG TPA: hypothetical protein VD994_19715 [Prosthecobacter sp.]|nr:hypothetical protein [Prosthecobacter sp.]